MNRNGALALGTVATIAATLLWHGPGGAGARVSASLDREVRAMLDHYEMQAVAAHVEHAPLTRRILLSGPADDFQRSEIKRMTEQLPGIANARWINGADPGRQLPLLAEAIVLALASFAAGVVLAYVAALRRRAKEDLLA